MSGTRRNYLRTLAHGGIIATVLSGVGTAAAAPSTESDEWGELEFPAEGRGEYQHLDEGESLSWGNAHNSKEIWENAATNTVNEVDENDLGINARSGAIAFRSDPIVRGGAMWFEFIPETTGFDIDVRYDFSASVSTQSITEKNKEAPASDDLETESSEANDTDEEASTEALPLKVKIGAAAASGGGRPPCLRSRSKDFLSFVRNARQSPANLRAREQMRRELRSPEPPPKAASRQGQFTEDTLLSKPINTPFRYVELSLTSLHTD